ncbi:glycosyltransferase family 2 protein [Aliikangiella sp. IMCC44359]|uniref:glycosyltransferase family 2 protein n=1 Tax=Aliikangiella sp. IMCC44359 TaxID=3459125 RepID=UPI00403ABCBD
MNNYSPCIVIPIYNHGEVFSQLLPELLSFNIPLVIVNDGSNQATQEKLIEIDKEHELVDVIHLAGNSGKGGAVIAGLKAAYKKEYTHALQVDADGQHNFSDIESFFIRSKNAPDSVICGYPVYDESVPLSRLIPRYITHFWVWVETLSFKIKDSMCGFRVYPLESTVSLLEQFNIGQRMDFDIEVLVRLYWKNIELNFYPTKVIYPKDGVSHFQVFHDNWLITKMHTKLFFGMLKRLPFLVGRKFKAEPKNKKSIHWGAKKEKGNFSGLRFLIWIYQVFGRRVFAFFLHPVIGYFVLTSTSARASSRTFWRNLYRFEGRTEKVRFGQIYAHFYEFGIAAIDKIACWMGDINRQDIILHGENEFKRISQSSQGAVFIGSHLGNIEVCRAIGERTKEFKINAVVFNKHAPKFQKALSQSNSQVEVNLIHVEKMGADTAILLKQKVEQGEVVIIVGDRTSVSSFGRIQYVDFLGKTAPFAEGPHILAGLLECPVYLLFCIKESGTYNVYLEHFADSLRFSRKDRAKKLKESVQRYAARLSYYCQKAPQQWFNFYDFWQVDKPEYIKRNNK